MTNIDLSKMAAVEVKELDQEMMSQALMKTFGEEYARQLGEGPSYFRVADLQMAATLFSLACIRMASCGMQDAAPTESKLVYAVRILDVKTNIFTLVNAGCDHIVKEGLEEEFKA